MGSPRDRWTKKRMRDRGKEDQGASQQEKVRRHGGGEFGPEVWLGGHAPPHRNVAGLAILGERLLGSRHDIGPGTTERLYEVDLRSQAILAHLGHGHLGFGPQTAGSE